MQQKTQLLKVMSIMAHLSLTKVLIFTVQHCASVIYDVDMCPSVCPSVTRCCCMMNRVGFRHRTLLIPIIHCTIKNSGTTQ